MSLLVACWALTVMDFIFLTDLIFLAVVFVFSVDFFLELAMLLVLLHFESVFSNRFRPLHQQKLLYALWKKLCFSWYQTVCAESLLPLLVLIYSRYRCLPHYLGQEYNVTIVHLAWFAVPFRRISVVYWVSLYVKDIFRWFCVSLMSRAPYHRISQLIDLFHRLRLPWLFELDTRQYR